MSTTMTSKNVSSVIADMKKKGFRTKFWREYRASAAKGQGVAKHLDQLEKLGLPADGNPAKADLDSMGAVIQLFAGLSNAMLKANGKCGKLQAETSKLCKAYREVIAIREAQATKLAQNADKIKIEQMQAQLKREKADEETNKLLDRYKEENDQKNDLIRKEIQSVGERGKKLEAAATTASKEVAKALKDMDTLMRAFTAKHDKEGTDNRDLEAKVLKALEDIRKKSNFDMHVKNIQGPFPKLLKEATSTFKQFNTLKNVKDERMTAGKLLAAAQGAFQQAQDDVKFFATQYKIATTSVTTARKEGA